MVAQRFRTPLPYGRGSNPSMCLWIFQIFGHISNIRGGEATNWLRRSDGSRYFVIGRLKILNLGGISVL